MSKVTITIDSDDPEKIAEALRAVEQVMKPTPDAKGKCRCKEPKWVHLSDWAGGDYCSKCHGTYY